MSLTVSIRHDWMPHLDTNRKAILAGATVTAVSTAVTFIIPFLIPMERIRSVLFDTMGIWVFGNPFTQIRVLGGIPGALLAGYLAENTLGSTEWETAIRVGVYATMAGLAMIYVVYVLYNLFSAVVLDGIFPPPLYLSLTIPFIFAIPLFPTYLFEGVIFGVFARMIRKSRGTAA